MPPTSSSPSLASILIARFLRTNAYTETLEAFIREAGLPRDVGQTSEEPNWTIEGILQEKKTFDQSLNFERYGEDEKNKDLWSEPGELLASKKGKPCFNSEVPVNHEANGYKHHPNRP